jgi:hypothetical protein
VKFWYLISASAVSELFFEKARKTMCLLVNSWKWYRYVVVMQSWPNGRITSLRMLSAAEVIAPE